MESTAAGSSYLELKYNLMITYCQMLTFYLLLKSEGTSTAELERHPVFDRLLWLKSIFEKLKPLDTKLQYQIQKMTQVATGQAQALKYKPNLDQMQASSSENEESDAKSDEKDEKEMSLNSSDFDSDAKGKGKNKGVYKAPKSQAVQYEDDVKAARK